MDGGGVIAAPPEARHGAISYRKLPAPTRTPNRALAGPLRAYQENA
jgi:hypothetical protein